MKPPPAPSAGDGNPARSSRRRELRRFLELFGLAGLVFAQPLLDVYGKSPDVLVNARLSSLATVAFALILIAVPPVVLWLVTWPLVLISARVEAIAHRVVLAGLAGLFLAQLINGTGRTVLALLGGVAVAVAMVVALARWGAIQRWLRYLSPAPLAFLALFVFASGAAPLILGGDGGSAAAVHVERPRPVVFILFDELPLVTLLDGSGHVDASRFPAFAELARRSTWFRNTTTPATFTTQAVPSILTGNIVTKPVAPVAAKYPDNLFTLLAGRYRMNVMEDVTHMCPDSQCTRYSGESTDLSGMLSGAARTWVERFQTKADTSAGAADVKFDEFKVDHDSGRFDQFIDQIQPDGAAPSLNFLHAVVPHFPWEFTPNGFRYDFLFATGGTLVGWSDEVSVRYGWSRHIAQTQYTDRELGRIIDRLKQADLWDDAVVVVTADHGLSFEIGEPMRGLENQNIAELLWVPLFIRGPGLAEGAVNDAPSSTVDILPTVADELGVELPWTTTGVSLRRGGSVQDDVRHVAPNPTNTVSPGADGLVEVAGGPQFDRVRRFPRFGSGTDDLSLFRQGPYASYIGSVVPRLATETSNTFFTSITPIDVTVEPGTTTLPIEVHGFLNGAPAGSWVAVALNGTIVGLVQPNLRNEFFAMLPDDRFVAGENHIHYYLVDGPPGGSRLRQLVIQDRST